MLSKKLIGIIVIVAVLLMTGAAVFLIRSGAVQPVKSITEWIEEGEKYLLDRKYEEAWLTFQKAIALEPKEIRAYLGAVDAGIHLEKEDQVKELLQQAMDEIDNPYLEAILIGLEKSTVEAYIALAEAYDAESLKDKALELLQRVYDETGDIILGRKLGIVQASEIVFKEDYVISWQDPEFERLIRQYLNKPDGDIHYHEVKDIEEIYIWGNIITDSSGRFSFNREGFTIEGRENVEKNGQIKSLTDLVHFPSLNSLAVNHQLDLDISALGQVEEITCLRRLRHLDLISNEITDISVISGLIALEGLNLSYNNIENIGPLSYLIELSYLHLSNNLHISSVEVLRGLRKLYSISLSRIESLDLSVFLELKELKSLHIVEVNEIDYQLLTKLDLTYLEITANPVNFPVICQLKGLENLRLHGNGDWNREEQKHDNALVDISGIEQLTNLNKLDLLASDCKNIQPLAALPVEILEIEVSKECDLSPLQQMKNLKKVILPRGRSDQEDVMQKLKQLLPGVEVTTDRY